MDSFHILDILLRGGAAGLLIAMTIIFLRSGRSRGMDVERLAALFCFGTGVYILISSPSSVGIFEPILPVLIIIATLNSVFFWWFATALFEDEFRWHRWRFVPLIVLVTLIGFRTFTPEWVAGPLDNITQQILIIGFMLHAMWLALAHLRDDLIEDRRRFRVVFAALIGLTGLLIAIGEIFFEGRTAPQGIIIFQGFSVFALSLGFAIWIFRPITLFAAHSEPLAFQGENDVPPEDKMELARLKTAMDAGFYTHDGLTIRILAEEIKVPEHRLRRLINGGLGFRNFSAFLNERRLADARDILSDPEQARRQITQIAFDLGYGSVAPFNRAFKAAEGVTPTTYRHVALRASPIATP